jgi:hypothetical protein
VARPSSADILTRQLRTGGSHPVRVVLDAASSGFEAEGRDFDVAAKTAAPEYRSEVRERLVKAARRCVELKRSGANQPARQLATATAQALSPMLAEHREHGLFDDPAGEDPAALAAKIPRGIGPIGPAA